MKHNKLPDRHKINLHCSNINIMPKLLITHFLHYLGYYVEEMIDLYSISENDIDIFILDNDFKIESPRVKISNVIFIGRIEERINSNLFISYDANNLNAFLLELTKKIFMIQCYNCITDCDSYLYKTNLDKILLAFISSYIKNEIFQCFLFAQSIPKSIFSKNAIHHYLNFIKELELLNKKYEDNKNVNGFTELFLLFAKYETNFLCLLSGFNFIFDKEQLEKDCFGFLWNDSNMIELHFILGDIVYYFFGRFKETGNRYQDYRFNDCYEVYLKLGKINQIKVRDYNSAIAHYKYVLQNRKYNYIAYYLMGECYAKKQEFKNLKSAINNVISVLQKKIDISILSPNEIIYLTKSILLMLQYKHCFDRQQELILNDNLKSLIEKEPYQKQFFDLVWSNQSDNQKLFSAISTNLEKELHNLVLEKKS